MDALTYRDLIIILLKQNKRANKLLACSTLDMYPENKTVN